MDLFLEKITSSRILARLRELSRAPVETQVLYFILNPPTVHNKAHAVDVRHPKILEWAHSIGACMDEMLRSMVPPIPPPALRSITAAPDVALFLWTGVVDIRTIITLYEEHKNPADPPRPCILDFGCGCGRMIRFLNDYPQHWDVHGCDVNKDHIAWCAENLKGIKTDSNDPLPPLSYENGTFHLVYSLSVLTHLNEESAEAWLSEIHRVLAPHGLFIATTHGMVALDVLSDSEMHREMFQLDQASVPRIIEDLKEEKFLFRQYDPDTVRMAKAGPDYGKTFIHPDYVTRHWDNEKFRVLRYIPGGIHGWQDIIVFQKR